MLGRAGKPALQESPPRARPLEPAGLGKGLRPGEACPPPPYTHTKVEIWFCSWMWVQGVNPLAASMPAGQLRGFGAGQARCWKMFMGVARGLRGTQAGPVPWQDALFLQHPLRGVQCCLYCSLRPKHKEPGRISVWSPCGQHVVRVARLSPFLIQALPNTHDPLGSGSCEYACLSLCHREIYSALKGVMAQSLSLRGTAEPSMGWPRFVVGRGHSKRLLLLAETLGQRAADAAGKRGSTGV